MKQKEKEKEKANADPRAFAIDVSSEEPIEVTLKQLACGDKETGCQKLTQSFAVSLKKMVGGNEPRSNALIAMQTKENKSGEHRKANTERVRRGLGIDCHGLPSTRTDLPAERVLGSVTDAGKRQNQKGALLPVKKYTREDSNLQPSVPKTDALSNCATGAFPFQALMKEVKRRFKFQPQRRFWWLDDFKNDVAQRKLYRLKRRCSRSSPEKMKIPKLGPVDSFPCYGAENRRRPLTRMRQPEIFALTAFDGVNSRYSGHPAESSCGSCFINAVHR